MGKYGILILGLLLSFQVAFASECSWKIDVKYEKKAANVKAMIFEVEDKPVFWTHMSPSSDRLATYQNFVSSKTSVDQNELRERQYKIFKKHLPNETKIMKLIMSGKVFSTGRAECFDLLLFDLHLDSVGTVYYAEFGAHVFVKYVEGRRILRVMFTSNPGGGVATPMEIEDAMSASLKDGWSLVGHIHNHPFGLDNLSGDIGGTCWPSDSDLNHYAKQIKFGMQGARITNGFDTIFMSAEDISQLRQMSQN